MVKQILLKHLPRRDEQVAVATLTAEFERALRWCVSSRSTGCCFDIRDDRNLQLALDLFHKRGKLGGCAYTGQFSLRWYSHIGFEGNVILGDNQSRWALAIVGLTKSIVAAI
jgi:hypothetical protein